ncbi:MAG: hypothetical protein OEQ53_00520, partial [Saprospiraceae bacterium]|nr:hypothetical protein [Saprospiraceae bacterium]
MISSSTSQFIPVLFLAVIVITGTTLIGNIQVSPDDQEDHLGNTREIDGDKNVALNELDNNPPVSTTALNCVSSSLITLLGAGTLCADLESLPVHIHNNLAIHFPGYQLELARNLDQECRGVHILKVRSYNQTYLLLYDAMGRLQK